MLPVSDTLTPEIPVATFCATVALDGAAMTGTPLTVTAIVLAPAEKLNWSVAFTVIGSEPAVASVSLRVARAVLTAWRDPLTVRLLVPDPVTVADPAVTDSPPFASLKAY